LGIVIELSDAVKQLLVEKGYDPNLGARPLRRAVQRYVEDPLSEEFLLGRFQAGDVVVAELDTESGTDAVLFRRKEAEGPEVGEKELVNN
jgi:ATP-dependent Clp protease ATP-binding subunit ClpC